MWLELDHVQHPMRSHLSAQFAKIPRGFGTGAALQPAAVGLDLSQVLPECGSGAQGFPLESRTQLWSGRSRLGLALDPPHDD